MIQSAALDSPALALIVTGFLAAAVRVATPLLLAALGETLSERAGVINLGLEGAMLAGALAAAVAGQASGPWAGTVAGIGAGILVSGGFAVVALGLGADQIITGTAITLASVGATGAIYRQVYGPGGAGLGLRTFEPYAIPGLSRIPVLGPGLFDQPVLSYLGFVLAPVLAWLLFRTRWGLAVRASGESPDAARASGVRVRLVRLTAVLLGGALGGLAGAALVLAQVGTFAERMTAGRGFVAIAIVVLGRWYPWGVVLAALVFGGATALQFVFQAMGLAVPYQLFLMLPYLLTLLALAGGIRRYAGPAALGRG
ncbi:MAG: ABC transporter permease [Gemmatimonadales bacterium]